jgi:hypothetical protein
MNEKIFDPNEPVVDQRRSERVELDNGVVYVKEMETADLLFCQEHSTRTGGPAGGTVDFSAMQIWQVVVSCYRGKEPEARRVFDITHTDRIRKLRREEWFKLRDAIDRVNGMAAEEAATVRDFTEPLPDGSPGTSLSSLSGNSAGFPVNSPSLIPA